MAKKKTVAKVYYTSRELAQRLGYSVKWVEKWRPQLAGACQIGRGWRFDKSIVDDYIAKGKNIVIRSNLTGPLRRVYIPRVHGAALSIQKEGS